MSGAETPTFEVRQAPDHLARRKIMAVTMASIVTMLVSLGVAWTLLERWGREPAAGPSPPAPPTIGMLEQTLVIDTQRGLDLRKQQEASLHRWGWVDRDAGVAHIPIDRAIDLFVDHPIPADRPISPLAPSSTVGKPEPPPEGKEVIP